MSSWITFLFLLFPIWIHATETQPWFGKDKLIESRFSYLFRHYPKINKKGHSKKFTSNDQFIDVGASLSPAPEWSAELEVIVADTKKHSGFDNVRLTGRYLLYNDVIGDPFSLTAGLTIDRASKNALHDISSFHHGLTEVSLHMAMGKEYVCEEFWVSRYWGWIALGMADRGSPWIENLLVYERNWWDRWQGGLFAYSLFGFGDKPLRIHHFRGYGRIAHRSLDLGFHLRYLMGFGTATIGYSYRIWSYNFPAQAHTGFLSLMIPFSF